MGRTIRAKGVKAFPPTGTGPYWGGESAMPKKAPWHSIKQSVHHNNTACNTGNNIERENIRAGTGLKPLCKECADLNARGK